MPVSSNPICVCTQASGSSCHPSNMDSVWNLKDWIWYAEQGKFKKKKKPDLNFLHKHSLSSIVNSLHEDGRCKLNPSSSLSDDAQYAGLCSLLLLSSLLPVKKKKKKKFYVLNVVLRTAAEILHSFVSWCRNFTHWHIIFAYALEIQNKLL